MENHMDENGVITITDWHGYCYKHKKNIWWLVECAECEERTVDKRYPVDQELEIFKPKCINTIFPAIVLHIVVKDQHGNPVTDDEGNIIKEKGFKRDSDNNIMREEKQVPVELVRTLRVVSRGIPKSLWGMKYLCPFCSYEFPPRIFEYRKDIQYSKSDRKPGGTLMCRECGQIISHDRIKRKGKLKGWFKRLFWKIGIIKIRE